MSYITANKVVKEFGDGDARVAAVQGIDLSIEQAGFISIMGESGAGKSTLLSMLGRPAKPLQRRDPHRRHQHICPQERQIGRFQA